MCNNNRSIEQKVDNKPSKLSLPYNQNNEKHEQRDEKDRCGPSEYVYKR